jgi:hypothetical protein
VDVDIVELTVWYHEHSGISDAFGKHLKKEIAARGGPADAALVRDWLRRRAADREGSVALLGEPVNILPDQLQRWARVTHCECGSDTKQLLHGYTESGRLWKGHVCACHGWQCSECGRILERKSECCR